MKQSLSDIELELLRMREGKLRNHLDDILEVQRIGGPVTLRIGASEADMVVPQKFLLAVPKGANAVYELFRTAEPDGGYQAALQYCFILRRKNRA